MAEHPGRDETAKQDDQPALMDLGLTSERLSETVDVAGTTDHAGTDAPVPNANGHGHRPSQAAVLREVRHAGRERVEEFWERAEATLFTDEERARRALDPVLLQLVPTAQAIREWKDYLTKQDRTRIEQHVASLVESLRREGGLKAVQ